MKYLYIALIIVIILSIIECIFHIFRINVPYFSMAPEFYDQFKNDMQIFYSRINMSINFPTSAHALLDSGIAKYAIWNTWNMPS